MSHTILYRLIQNCSFAGKLITKQLCHTIYKRIKPQE